MMIKRLQTLGLVLFFAVALIGCEGPTTGDEIYDGDPETSDPVPEEMEEHAQEEIQDSTFDREEDDF